MKEITIVFTLILILTSCSKPANNGIPAYVSIADPILQVELGQGSALHDISTIWAESEGENFGVYELPTVFPALVSGNRQMILNAGVKQSGDFFTREIYPCFDPFIETFNFVQKDTLYVQPVFKYKNQTQFLLIEDFENSNIFTGMNRTTSSNPNNLEGIAGQIVLNQGAITNLSLMGSSIPLARTGRTYLEVHFKGLSNFFLGAQGFKNGDKIFDDVIIPLYKTQDWQKIYIEITFLLNFVDADEYAFYIRANLPPNLNESEIFIDNFKIVRI